MSHYLGFRVQPKMVVVAYLGRMEEGVQATLNQKIQRCLSLFPCIPLGENMLLYYVDFQVSRNLETWKPVKRSENPEINWDIFLRFYVCISPVAGAD